MSTLDDKAKDVTGDTVTNYSSKSKIVSRSGFVILSFIVGLVVSMTLGWIVFPKLLYSEKQQPFNFDHALHVKEVSGKCVSCHFFYDDGSFSGVPKNKQCLECHFYAVIGETKDEAIYVKDYLVKKREVPWLVYSRQPDCVFFSHAAHVKGSEKLDCAVCHGNIGQSKVSRPYEYNRITGYSRDIWGKNIAGIKINTWDRMKMDDCAECHKEANGGHNSSVQTGRDACFVCHK